MDRPTEVSGPSAPAFSDNSKTFSNEKTSCYLYDRLFGPKVRTVHKCAERGNLPIIASVGWKGINRSGARVWELS
jgi:hypothetical protein